MNLAEGIFIGTVWLVLLINLVGFWMAFWVYLAKTKENRRFFVMTALLLLWVDLGFLSNSTSDYLLALNLKRLVFATIALFLPTAYFFVNNFPRRSVETRKRLDRMIILCSSALFLVSAFTPLVIRDIEFKNWGVDAVMGSGILIYYIAVLAIIALVVQKLISNYLVLSGVERRKTVFFLVGIVLFAGINVLFNVLIPAITGSLELTKIGDLSTIVFLGFTAYAIVSRNLFNIRTIAAKVIAVFIVLFSFAQIFISSSDIEIAIRIGFFLLMLVFAVLLVRGVSKEVKLREKIEQLAIGLDGKTKDLEALLDVTRGAISSLDPTEVAQKIVDAIPVKLAHVEFVAGLMVDYDERQGIVTPKTLTRTPLTEEAVKLLKAPLTSFGRPLDTRKPLTLIGRTILTRQIQMSDELSEFISPYVPVAAAKAMQKILGVSTIISVPMVVRGAVVGAFIFLSKRNPHTITDRERDLAIAFANNMGLAVENARLYGLIQEKAKELGEKNAYLKQLDEAKSNFLSIASHQLRTPITAIKGYLSMLHDGDFGTMTLKQNEIVGFNLQNVERLVKLIDVFLDVSRIEAGRLVLTKKETEVVPIIESVIQELAHEVDRRGLYLKLEKPKQPLPRAFIDEEKMRHVILNLIDNATKYTAKGGITVRPVATDSSIRIEVRDTGIGLRPEDARNLFGKFVRAEGGAKINSNGSGLGLFIIKGIVEAHNGRAWVESDGEGQGSRFYVEFPVGSAKENTKKD